MKIGIEKLISGLREIPDESFTCEEIYRFLGDHPVETASIERFCFWSDRFYTRNLVFKDERFEVMVLCWEKGQASRIHNHADQRCWMTVVEGKLRGQNFVAEEIDESRGYCRLKESELFDLSDCLAAKVELEEPIHQILNLPEFDSRAISIHVYSRPFDKCLAYCIETNSFKEVNLAYSSIDGVLCQGISL